MSPGSGLDLAAAEAQLRQRLDGLLRIPSVSTDPTCAAEMRAAQRHLVGWLHAIGLGETTVLEGGGHGAVFAQRLDAPPGRPTVLVYGHYDVQPPDPVDLWDSPPFTPTERDGRLYARGASDDKGPLAIALEAIGALIARDGHAPVNLKLLLEGEEEVGSRTLAEIVNRHRALLATDVVVSADGARWRADLPTVTVATRGNTGFEFTVRTAGKDLHSGRYGGIVPNALHVVAALVASLHDADGRIAVPGFHEGIEEPSAEERAAARAIPFDEAALFAGIGARPHGEAGYATLERLWFRPTLEANGMWGGYQGPGSKTVIPCEARAKLTMRLVPGQDPVRVAAAVAAHLRLRCPPHAALEIGPARAGAPAYALPANHPVLHVVEGVLQEVHGTRPRRVRMGATLPVNAIFRDRLGAETLMLSYATADEDFHAPNEHIRLSAFAEGLRAWTLLLDRLAALTPAQARGGA